MYDVLLSHSSTDGHLTCFHLAIVNNATMYMDVQIPIWEFALNFFEEWSC